MTSQSAQFDAGPRRVKGGLVGPRQKRFLRSRIPSLVFVAKRCRGGSFSWRKEDFQEIMGCLVKMHRLGEITSHILLSPRPKTNLAQKDLEEKGGS